MRCEVINLQLFDVGGTFDLAALDRSLQAGPKAHFTVGKGTPGYVEFPEPLAINLPALEIETPTGPRTTSVQCLFFQIGAISVRFRTTTEVEEMRELHSWSQSRIRWDAQPVSMLQAAKRLVERLRPQWEGAIRDRYTSNLIHETYTVFAFGDVGETAESFFEHHPRDIAGLLKGEDGGRLHEKEVHEALRKWFSYYTDDLTVIDWDAAVIIDPSPEYEDVLFVLEIANLQLLEFRSYDEYLDRVTARGYDELGVLFRRPSLFRNARKTAHDLSLLRFEIAELADEADNITKFLGDWYLARVYEAAQEKFHLQAWRTRVDEKLATLFTLYQVANAESDNFRLVTLELMIVLLFILDLVVIVLVP